MEKCGLVEHLAGEPKEVGEITSYWWFSRSFSRWIGVGAQMYGALNLLSSQ
jgi:hypothetical protein